MSRSCTGAVAAAGRTNRTTPCPLIDFAQLSALPANTNGRTGVHRNPDAARVSSTARCSSAIALPTTSGNNTLPDDNNTTCSTPALRAAPTNPSAPCVGA